MNFSSVKLTASSSSGTADIYLSLMETVADKFSHSWTAAPQLPLTHKLDYQRGLMNKDVIKALLLHPQSFPTDIWRIYSRYHKQEC